MFLTLLILNSFHPSRIKKPQTDLSAHSFLGVTTFCLGNFYNPLPDNNSLSPKKSIFITNFIHKLLAISILRKNVMFITFLFKYLQIMCLAILKSSFLPFFNVLSNKLLSHKNKTESKIACKRVSFNPKPSRMMSLIALHNL